MTKMIVYFRVINSERFGDDIVPVDVQHVDRLTVREFKQAIAARYRHRADLLRVLNNTGFEYSDELGITQAINESYENLPYVIEISPRQQPLTKPKVETGYSSNKSYSGRVVEPRQQSLAKPQDVYKPQTSIEELEWRFENGEWTNVPPGYKGGVGIYELQSEFISKKFPNIHFTYVEGTNHYSVRKLVSKAVGVNVDDVLLNSGDYSATDDTELSYRYNISYIVNK